MKKVLLSTVLLLLCASTYTDARIGCWQYGDEAPRTHKFDTKAPQYVQCNCPCEKQYNQQANGSCMKCGHYHDPAPLHIVNVQKSSSTNFRTALDVPQVNIKKLRAYGDKQNKRQPHGTLSLNTMSVLNAAYWENQ